MIQFNCPGCQAPYSVSDEKAGKSGKCPKCQTPFTVPMPADEPESKATVAERSALTDDEPQPSGVRTLPHGPIALVRIGQALDLAALVALVFAVAVIYFGAFAGASERARQIRDEREQVRSQFERDAQAWLRRRADGDEQVPPPEPPPRSAWHSPTEQEAALDTLSRQMAFRMPSILPAFLLLASGVLTAVGRFRLARAGAGTGGGRVFFFTGFLAVGQTLAALMAVSVAWSITAEPGTVLRGNGEVFPAAGIAFGAALLFGTIGEALSLPGLALIGWVRQAPEEHRKRIATAAAFYPFLPLALVFLGAVVGLLGGADFSVAVLGVAGAIGLLALRVLGHLVVSRAYRFPPATDAVS